VAMLLDGIDAGSPASPTPDRLRHGVRQPLRHGLVRVAPALVAYEWSLRYMGKLGWLAAFIYTAAAALRLARFNTQVAVADKRYFQGLPSPSAAAIVAVWSGSDRPGAHGEGVRHVASALTVVAGC